MTSIQEATLNLTMSARPWVRLVTFSCVLLVGTLSIALYVGILGPVIALATALAIIGGTMILLDTHWGFVALIGVLFGLPFATLPFSIGFKPTLLDVSLGALFAVWLLKLITGGEKRFIGSPLGIPVVFFILMALFSFFFGLSHSSANSYFVRRFAEIMIGIALFFAIINTVRTSDELCWVARWLMLGGASCAAIAVLFYFLPESNVVWVLDRLARFDYPGGYGALRWIEDDPAGTMRAIGTAVDPNVLGGMMILAAGLMAPQPFAERPLLPRWLSVCLFCLTALALYLTYSRSALLGLASAVGFVAILKYRWLIPLGMGIVLLLLTLPLTQDYVSRLQEGFALQDLATQMRLGEYKDAIILIRRYPLFGVGFTGVPDIDLYLGVSMLYLIMAENMGLVGLAVFLSIIAIFFGMVFRSWRRGYGPDLEPILLGLAGAVTGALVSGFFDHYWFNLTYPHMTVLFWLFLGLCCATVLIHENKRSAAFGEKAV